MNKTGIIKTMCIMLTGLSVAFGTLIAKDNFNESRLPEHTFPDPLVTLDGTAVTNPDIWWKIRRPEILGMVETEMYGRASWAPEKMVSRIVSMQSACPGSISR